MKKDNKEFKVKGISWKLYQFSSFEAFDLFLMLNKLKVSELEDKDKEKIEITRRAIAEVIISNTPRTRDYKNVVEYIRFHIENGREDQKNEKLTIEWTKE